MFTVKDTVTMETLLALNKYVHEWHVNSYPDIFRPNAGIYPYHCRSSRISRPGRGTSADEQGIRTGR